MTLREDVVRKAILGQIGEHLVSPAGVAHQGLIGFIADGDRSEYVVSTVRDLEAGAKSERAGIDRLSQAAKEPRRLPSVEEVVGMATDLEARAAQDPIGARAQIQRWHKGGAIRVARTRPDRSSPGASCSIWSSCRRRCRKRRSTPARAIRTGVLRPL